MKRIIFTLAIIITSLGLQGQTADILSGCAPLEVNFTGPTGQSDYFWSFGTGGFSDQMNPAHIFDQSGVFTVELFDSQGGTKVGEIDITVYAKPQFAISADPIDGCTPLQVQFTNESIVDPNVNITGYLWDFGDGNSSTIQNPTHFYTTQGIFSVTLKIESDEEGCTETMTFPDFIQVSGGVVAGFSLDKLVSCEAPGSFTITNNTVDGSLYTYLWDFDNGDTSTDYNPGTVMYTEEGTYTIRLTIDNGEGCVVNLTRTVTVGKPPIIINPPDTVCLGVPFTIVNNSNANQYAWSFGSGANPQNTGVQNPTIVYSTAGSKIVTYSSIASNECKSDTFFTIFVEDPSAAFTIDPFVTCLEPATYTFTHPNPTFKSYLYYIKELDETINGAAEEAYTYTPLERDSFYINRSDTFTVYLDIETNAGCKALDSAFFLHRAPQAHFIPNVSRGCAPLTVNFTEDSKSNEPITSWTWIFGDGTVTNSTMPENMTHTYTDPGEYYVKIAIENEDGCRDTSAGIFIYVGEPLNADFTIDKTEICLYESISLNTDNLDPRIDAYHFNTDEGRISDCYNTPNATHEFIHSPGTYPVTLTLEYNGCFSEVDNGTTVTVNGSKARIKYMTNCEEPLMVMLQDSSVNATTSIWYIDGDTINMDTIAGDVFNYTFDDSGDYDVKLVTTDDSACDADSSIVTLSIREISARFTVPDHLCARVPLIIDAGASQDVDDSCSKGYTWFGVARRPRTLDIPTVEVAYEPGVYSITLITEDVNGCTATTTMETTVLDIAANFTPTQDIICYPSTVSFEDLSSSDTTITDWNWSFGSNAQNPTSLFDSGPSGSIPIELTIEDALGCKDTTQLNLAVYAPTSTVTFDPGNIVCLGETIDFMATDFTEQGHFLDFQWLFDGTFIDEQNPNITITQAGNNTISLFITEDSTGCNNQYDFNIQGIELPIAEFETDGIIFCVSDNIVEFTNLSTIDGPGAYFWNYDNGVINSTGVNPDGTGTNTTSTFEAGTYDITLTANSIYGCTDTYTSTINVTEPSGNFAVSETNFCVNDNITFTLFDTMNVTTYTWDFGDGATITDQSPATHSFNFFPPGGMYNVILALTDANDCKTSVSVPVQALNLDVNLTPETACPGEILFEATAQNSGLNVSYSWSFENGETSTDANPLILVENSDTAFVVNLTVTENVLGCVAELTDTVLISPIPDVDWEVICDTTDRIFLYIKNFNADILYTVDPPIDNETEIINDTTFIDLTEGFEYVLTATNDGDCPLVIPFIIEPETEIQLPNLFSPNGDQRNDYFDLIIMDKFRPTIPDPLVFKVFNRWGNLMYDNETPDVGWDGKLSNGEFAPAEIYTYIVKIQDNNTEGGVKTFKGTVTLIK